MGLVQNIRKWNQQRFSKKMDDWYKNKKQGDGDSMEYNPMLSHINFQENQLQNYVDTLNENFAWSKSDPATLFKLYSKYRDEDTNTARRGTSKKGINRTVESNWWYAKLFIDNEEGVENAVRYSTGVAAKIPSTMATLCMGNGYSYSLQLGEEDIDEENEKYEELEYILEENNINSLLFKGFRTQSWAGGFAFKWSMHAMFDTPVLEVVSPMNYRYKSVAGRIIEDIFSKYYYRDEHTYKLEEAYGVDEIGAYIKFKLYKVSNISGKDESFEECPLFELEDTQSLKDVHIAGYFNRLSIYVPNKAINSRFPNSLYGESDFTGSYGALNFLDEAYSTYSQELRDGRLVKYMPDTMGDFDEAGNATYASFLRSTHLVVKGGIGQDADDKIEYKQANVDTEKSKDAIKQNYMIVLNNAGLSPLTFGLTGLEAIDASAESQQEREKVSIRTRNGKNDIQEPAISRMLAVGYDLYQIFKDFETNAEGVYTTTLEPSKVIFKFEDYILKSKLDRVKEVESGLTSGVYDLKTAIDYVHDDLTDDEKILLRVNSKIEKGIGTFTKEEELVYLKYIATVVEEEPEFEAPVEEVEEIQQEEEEAIDEQIQDTEE